MDVKSFFWRCSWVWLALAFIPARVGAESAETVALRAASELFQDGHYALAEKKFNDFLAAYTNSPHRADAILSLAQANVYQSNNAAAINLLEKSFPSADESHKRDYVFWIAKAQLNAGHYRRAAEGFGNIARNPNSTHTLEAAYDEAESYARIPDWPHVIELLQQTNEPFHLAAAAAPADDSAIMGRLLLGEAYQATQHYAEGEKVVRAIQPAGLKLDFRWQRLYLLCQLELAQGRATEALRDTTNLLDIAIGARHQARSQILRGDVLQQLLQPAEALEAYKKDLADGIPADEQRAALERIIDVTMAIHSPAAAVQALETLAAQRSQSVGLDLIWSALGDLYLKLTANPPKLVEGTNVVVLSQTNYQAGALSNLNLVLQNSTNGQLLARAHLDRGWCEWLQSDVAAAHADFLKAAAGLPFSEDQAVARMKVGDTDLYLHNDAAAVSNYTLVLKQYSKLAAVTNDLFAQALYQTVVGDIALNNLPAAEAAARKILAWFPGILGDRSLLAVGKDFDYRRYDYAQARRVFEDLLKRSPQSPLAPEVEYAIGRTYAHERNWPAAIENYRQWETSHPHDPLYPEVDFSLAHAYDKVGQQTNAFMHFTNFVAQYPSNSLWRWAKNWVADYYYNQEDYPKADLNYQQLYQSPAAGDLSWQAHLWAGRAALNHSAIDDARQDFYDLASSDPSNTPPNLQAQAWFALGDTILQQSLVPPVNTTNFNQAIYAVSNLTNGAPTNAIAIEALGRLGDYYMHWANITNAPEAYDKAAQMYRAILSYPPAKVNVSARCQAEVGLGLVAEHQHHPQEALEHYFNVLYAYDSDNFDPYWIWRAGEFAGRLSEELQQWDSAIKVYRIVMEAVPSLRPALERKIAADQAHAEAARN